ncbi:transferrin-binding protein-like solute binding protein [Pasteurellaceae bacterium TAE3-ERU1]|nr:transferrin-binding protein-like solute binding protein [Pasteurellaceae bacterium TAE3-ERU1]
MFKLPKKTALCILVALGATGCLSTNNDQPQPKEPINTSAQKTNADKKPASNNQNNQSAVDQGSTSQEDKKPTAPADEAKKPAEPTKPAEPSKPAEPAKPAEPEKPAEPVSPAQPDLPAEPAKPAEPVTPPALEKTEAQITAEKINAFNQRNYQGTAKSLQAKDYNGEDRYYAADVDIKMGNSSSINVVDKKGFVNLPLGDFTLPSHGYGNYRKTEYGYNNVYSTIIFADYDARTASDIYGTQLDDINALPQEGSAKYYGTIKGANALNGNVILNTDFAEKTVEGKITDLKDAKNSVSDITLEKSKIETAMNDWTYEDEVVFKGKATGGKSEWKDLTYEGHFYGPSGEEAAGTLKIADPVYPDSPIKQSVAVFTTTRDDQK